MQVASLTNAGVALSDDVNTGEISRDGSAVLFSTDQGDVDPSVSAPNGGAYRRSLSASGTTLVSRADGAAGTPADVRTFDVSISGDGRCAVFESIARNLGVGLEPGNSRVWMRAAAGACPTPAPPRQLRRTAGPTPAGPTGGGTPPPLATPGGSTVAALGRPVVTGFKATPATFSTKGKKRGTRFSFRVDQAAKARIAIRRSTKGYRVGKSCRAGKAKRGQKSCTRTVTLTTLKANAKANTTTTIRFTGTVKRKRLKRGAYTASLTAVGAGGTSKTNRIRIRAR